jgi:hypothetical protein
VLFTDQGDILTAGENVSTRIEEDIRNLIGNDQLETLNEIIGDVHQGFEHARDGLIVWRAASLEVTEASMFIGGLSGETARVTHPVTGEGVILRKTLQRDYLIPGDPIARGSEARRDGRSEEWVLR